MNDNDNNSNAIDFVLNDEDDNSCIHEFGNEQSIFIKNDKTGVMFFVFFD